ncbi:MAG: dihydroorotate dehydrogenase [Nitrososphaeria archaeon]
MSPVLKTKLAVLEMDNPLMLASGVLGMTPSTVRRVASCGAGAVVTKSVGLHPRDGYSNPSVYIIESYGLINAMGLPNPGVEEFVKEFRGQRFGFPVIYSIYGSSPREYSEVAKKLTELNPSALELNLSCPHVKEVGVLIGQDPMMVSKVVGQVKRSTNVPVFAKITPNVSDAVEIAEAAVRAGADAIVAINTVQAMSIDVDAMVPVLANRSGGLSGPAIKPIALKIVYDLYESCKVPIVGVGGIQSWKDAVEYFLAGATAVQVGSAIVWRGIEVFQDILVGLRKYMVEKRFSCLEELVGRSHQ